MQKKPELFFLGASCMLYGFYSFSHIWFDNVFGYVFCPCLARRG